MLIWQLGFTLLSGRKFCSLYYSNNTAPLLTQFEHHDYYGL